MTWTIVNTYITCVAVIGDGVLSVRAVRGRGDVKQIGVCADGQQLWSLCNVCLVREPEQVCSRFLYRTCSVIRCSCKLTMLLLLTLKGTGSGRAVRTPRSQSHRRRYLAVTVYIASTSPP